MTEPRKVWVCFEMDPMRASSFVYCGTDDGFVREKIRSALARKPEEEPWEGWTSVEDRDDPEAQTVWYEPQAMAAAEFTMRRVLVIPLPEEKP